MEVTMKRLVVLIAVAVCVLLIVPVASSQVMTGTIKTHVDADFMVGEIRMPAGDYSFSFDTATSRMYIHNQNTLETVSVFTRDIVNNSTPTQNKLVFRQDGKQRVLHQVWSEQAGHVHEIVHGTEVQELVQK
jgi:hypothetical protein